MPELGILARKCQSAKVREGWSIRLIVSKQSKVRDSEDNSFIFCMTKQYPREFSRAGGELVQWVIWIWSLASYIVLWVLCQEWSLCVRARSKPRSWGCGLKNQKRKKKEKRKMKWFPQSPSVRELDEKEEAKMSWSPTACCQTLSALLQKRTLKKYWIWAP